MKSANANFNYWWRSTRNLQYTWDAYNPKPSSTLKQIIRYCSPPSLVCFIRYRVRTVSIDEKPTVSLASQIKLSRSRKRQQRRSLTNTFEQCQVLPSVNFATKCSARKKQQRTITWPSQRLLSTPRCPKSLRLCGWHRAFFWALPRVMRLLRNSWTLPFPKGPCHSSILRTTRKT